MDILNDRNFDLNSLVIQTSTIGNIKTLSTFAEKHCKNLEKFTLTALRLPPKGLSLLFRIDLKRIKMICGEFVLELSLIASISDDDPKMPFSSQIEKNPKNDLGLTVYHMRYFQRKN